MNEEEITKEKAEEWYEKTGTSIVEDPEEITLNEHTHLLYDSVMLIVREVLDEFPPTIQVTRFSFTNSLMLSLTQKCHPNLSYENGQNV